MSRIATAPRDKNKTNQIVATPPEFIAAVEKRFGLLHCDVCARQSNAKAPLYIGDPRTEPASVPPGLPMRVGLNGLSCVWPNPGPKQWNWMNPPFKDTPDWLAKIHQERVRTLVLVLASVGSVWYRDLVENQAAVYFLGPRLTFVGETHPYPKELMLLAYDFDLLEQRLLNLVPSQWRWKPARGDK